MKKTIFAALAFLMTHTGYAAACNPAPPQQILLGENYMYEVAGTGRLFLYTAPDEACIDKALFVIPGDNLTAYAEFGKEGEWTSAMYIAKNGKGYSGWVRTNRLKFTGASGPDMSPGAVKFYEKAAAAAKAGKLGSPGH